jgi:hypothetical protein
MVNRGLTSAANRVGQQAGDIFVITIRCLPPANAHFDFLHALLDLRYRCCPRCPF